MIQKHELRIGNLFNDVDGTPCYFAGVWERNDGWMIRDSAGNTYKEVELHPIPLTPEILLKCGFVFNEPSLSYRIFSNKEEWILAAQQTTDKTCFKIGLPTDKRTDQYMTSLVYLHELQNLYYSLTKTELNYQP